MATYNASQIQRLVVRNTSKIDSRSRQFFRSLLATSSIDIVPERAFFSLDSPIRLNDEHSQPLVGIEFLELVFLMLQFK